MAAFMIGQAENRLLAGVSSLFDHVLRLLFPSIIIQRPGLRIRPHGFTLRTEDDNNSTEPFFIGSKRSSAISLYNISSYYM